MKTERAVVSDFDKACYKSIRENVTRFMAACGRAYDNEGILVLDIAPQAHEGAAPHFPRATVRTFDKDPAWGADLIGDITKMNDVIPSESVDIVVCTEVLEHTTNPFAAVGEIKRILKPDGRLLSTTPFNFRIHGPIPDCWRFTEHGLRELFREFTIERIEVLQTPDRDLMPMHYTVVARKNRTIP